MKNKRIAYFLSTLFLVIILFVVIDYQSKKHDKRKGNPYEFSINDFTSVDTSLIKYIERKQIKINCGITRAICYNNNQIFLLADNYLQVINLAGKELSKKIFMDEPVCIAVKDDLLAIGFKNSVSTFDTAFNILYKTEAFPGKSFLTAIGLSEKNIYVADAGLRKVVIFNFKLEKTGEIEGESGASTIHGFIIPSPYFDLAINPENELWVVNPGMHVLQHYRDDGSLIDFWGKSSIDINGFSGCCNPAHFTFLQNGDFITSEKGLIRIKIYDLQGKLKAVVASPEKFPDGNHAPDLTADEAGNVYALDYDKKLIRIFQPK